MKYERLDKGCFAEVLAFNATSVLIKATWRPTQQDWKKFQKVTPTLVRNITRVSRNYFEQRYGVRL